MFEAVFNIVALVESNGQGQRLFKVFEQGAPVNDPAFSSLVASVYQQDVYRTLRAGDTLAIAMHLDTPPRVDGVMPSWSIPKGPSLDSSVKRLAMPTEDHPLEYRHFEGVIGEDQYGAGTVMVWDEGTYTPEREISKGAWQEITHRNDAEAAMREGLRAGNVKFRLYGKKLQGSFALVRTRGFGKKESWVLIKHHDEYVRPGYDANDYDFSAVSNRTLAEIAAQEA